MNIHDSAIADRLLFDFPDVQTDVGIIMGARGVTGEVARKAAQLHHQGRFKKIIIVGGLSVYQPSVWLALKASSLFQPLKINRSDFLSTGVTENAYALSVLLCNGVCVDSTRSPQADKSTNTSENFNHIAQIISDENIKSATIITPAYHQRRGIETCAQILPDLDAFPHAVYPFGITRDSWPKTLVAGIVRGEFNKLDPSNPQNYYDKGFCKPVDMNALKKKAAAYAPA